MERRLQVAMKEQLQFFYCFRSFVWNICRVSCIMGISIWEAYVSKNY